MTSQEKLWKNINFIKVRMKREGSLFACNFESVLAVWAQGVTHSQEMPSTFLPSGKKSCSVSENMCRLSTALS